jgi:hypothetical protein
VSGAVEAFADRGPWCGRGRGERTPPRGGQERDLDAYLAVWIWSHWPARRHSSCARARSQTPVHRPWARGLGPFYLRDARPTDARLPRGTRSASRARRWGRRPHRRDGDLGRRLAAAGDRVRRQRRDYVLRLASRTERAPRAVSRRGDADAPLTFRLRPTRTCGRPSRGSRGATLPLVSPPKVPTATSSR